MEFMDLVFSRYSSPFILLETLVKSKRLSDFIDVMMKKEEETKLWQMYLQTIYTNKTSFNEFVESLKLQGNEKMTEDEFGAIVNDSKDILDSFNPTE